MGDKVYLDDTPASSKVSSKDLWSECVYNTDSNTVFYYNDYKVLIVLDFSKSTSTVIPYQ